jgi:diguanylate cyclase (GGDEF)-like protein
MELRRLAYRDHLTQLPNRIAMADRIEAAVVRSRREDGCTALLLIDIVAFKRVNNTLGHRAGDELLRLVADRLRTLREPRVDVGRQGGDEFVLLVDDLPPDPALAKARVTEIGQRVLAALQEPFTVASSSFEISASVGGSIFPLDATTHHELVDHADQATSLAKRRGRGQMALFDKPQTYSVLELESSLRIRQALSNGELELFYQPVVDIVDDHSLSRLEALLRWRDPDRGLVLPGAFLPFIEHSSLVVEIAEWVFTGVCRQLADWSSRGFSPRISFNVPARQLQHPGFAQFVTKTAAAYGVDLMRLAAEITETSPIAMEEVMPALTALREAGLLLSLDDFGTGYSSLARLRSMPFTLLKTDRSFMTGIPGDPVAEELLEGIIVLGKALGMHVIVEGVETAEQERELLRLGCRTAQGYHLGAPAPAAEIEARWSVRSRRRWVESGSGPGLPVTPGGGSGS